MDKLDTMKLFLRVAEAGSFSKAAHLAGITQSTVSKHIAGLEKRLGSQLVRRTSRGLALTAAGQHYYDDALRLVDDFQALEDAVSERERSPAGEVRVTSPPGFAALYLLPRMKSFLTQYPKLTLDFLVSQRLTNLVEERIDVAIRMGDLEDSELRSRQVGTLSAIVVASAAYLDEHGEPRLPTELGQHACISSMRNGRPRPWRFRQGTSSVVIDPKGTIKSEDVELTKAAVMNGLGIAYAASWLFKEELSSGDVRQILPDYECTQFPISAVWSGDRTLPRRAAVFIDFLAAVCAAEPTLRMR